MRDKPSVVTTYLFSNLYFILLNAVFPLVGCEGKKGPTTLLMVKSCSILILICSSIEATYSPNKSIKNTQNCMFNRLFSELQPSKILRRPTHWASRELESRATGIIFFHIFTKDLLLVLQFSLSFVVFHLHGFHKDLLQGRMAYKHQDGSPFSWPR